MAGKEVLFSPTPDAQFRPSRFSVGESPMYQAKGLVRFSDVQRADGTFDRHDVPDGAQVVQLDIETLLSFRGENRDRFLVVDPERWQVQEFEYVEKDSSYREKVARYGEENGWSLSDGVRRRQDGSITNVLVAYREKPAMTK